jgi:hypothetical protein
MKFWCKLLGCKEEKPSMLDYATYKSVLSDAGNCDKTYSKEAEDAKEARFRKEERDRIEAEQKLEEFRAYGRQQEEEWTKEAAEIHRQVFRRNHETDTFIEYAGNVIPCSQIAKITIQDYGQAPQYGLSITRREVDYGYAVTYEASPFKKAGVEVWHNDLKKIFRYYKQASISITFYSGLYAIIKHNDIVILSLYEALITAWKGPEFNVVVQEPSKPLPVLDN